jgi:thiol-disulfide isomerase/thioredoxin
MAQNDRVEVDNWVDARLAALAPDDNWQPNAAARLADVTRRRVAARSRRFRWMVSAGAMVIVGMSIPEARTLGSRCLDACVAATSRATQLWRGDEPNAGRPPEVGAAIGDLAPDLLGADSHGAPILLSAFRGHVVVVNFWATWCAPCKAEIPRLNDLHNRYAAQGLDIVGVSVDENGWAAVTPFAAQHQIAYTLTLASDEITAAFGGVTALPMTVVIDRDGRIVRKMVGQLFGEHDETLQIDRLLH